MISHENPDVVHQHGGTPGRDQVRFNLPPGPVLDFSVNLNCLGPPQVVHEKWMDLLPVVENYPGVESGGLARFYGERFGIPGASFLGGNGSTEMIYLALRVLRPKRLLVLTPSYHDYERAARLSGSIVTRFPLSSEKGFALPGGDALAGALRDVDAIFLGRPNNPTGGLIPKKTILDLAATFPGKWFFIDEAFIQFPEAWREEREQHAPTCTPRKNTTPSQSPRPPMCATISRQPDLDVFYAA